MGGRRGAWHAFGWGECTRGGGKVQGGRERGGHGKGQHQQGPGQCRKESMRTDVMWSPDCSNEAAMQT